MKIEVFFLSDLADFEIDTTVSVLRSLGYEPEEKGFFRIPPDSFFSSRNQYNAGIILNYVSRLRKGRALGVMKEDIYFQNLNFVFGIASPTAKVALVSFARLNPEFWGYPFDKELYISRIRKEITHEIGHLEGLVHCQNPKCVMSFSNSIYDVDLKEEKFCSVCLKQLGKSYF